MSFHFFNVIAISVECKPYYDCSPESRFTTFHCGLSAVSCNFIATWCNLICSSCLLTKADETQCVLSFIRKSFHVFLGDNHIIEMGDKIMTLKNEENRIKKVVQTSLMIAFAMVVRSFSYMVYLGGAPGMRISFSGVFTKIAAILFGPLYGGIASGLVDVIGFIIKPEGAYIPWLTVTSIFGGIITGFLWIVLKNVNTKTLQRTFILFFTTIGILGIANYIHVSLIPDSKWAQIINSIGKYRDFTSIGLMVASLIGLIFLLIDQIVKKVHNNSEMYNDFLKILVSTSVSGITVTTLNTYILRIFIPSLGKMGFLILWIPRAIEEILMVIIQAYVISILLFVFRKHIQKC
jgi:ECF transporter S component (folate family)